LNISEKIASAKKNKCSFFEFADLWLQRVVKLGAAKFLAQFTTSTNFGR
jgi:hypothetical protein